MSRTLSPTWITNAEDVSFPPEPWHLRGFLHASIWAVPLADIPSLLPQGTKAIAWRGRALVVTAWVVYGPGSVLEYNEFMAAVVVRAKIKPAVTVTHIWVDSPASAAGGRALWGIPKELGTFRTEAGAGFETSLMAKSGSIASFQFVRRVALPGHWRIAGRTAQAVEGSLKLTKFQALGRVQFGRGTWDFKESGPLRFLRERKPLLSLRFDQMAVSFGVRSDSRLSG
jgi:hypothetical protein